MGWVKRLRIKGRKQVPKLYSKTKQKAAVSREKGDAEKSIALTPLMPKSPLATERKQEALLKLSTQ